MPSLLVYKEISTSSDLGLILLLAEKPSKKISKTDQISLQFSAGEQLSIKIIVVGLLLSQVLHCMKIQRRDLHLHIKGQSEICIKTLDKVDDDWGISYWREIFTMLHFVMMCIVVCMKCLVYSIMFSSQFDIVIGIK